ncbi:GNAT family N-acetyltransferase [Paenibacillus germinis]|nr:GNAT family N-acetyltransferase [Paenibacillus germinis]
MLGNSKMEPHIYVRLLHSVEELTLVQELEGMVWEADHPLPIHQTITAVKNGGIVLGAYDEDKLVGFQYSFAGFDGKKAYLCSHTLGIHTDYRKCGIGEMLKRAQREEAIKKGYDLITWTYDSLETVNANLNIKKLGAICSQYIENCYGEMPDALNAGIPSDRLLAEWWIISDHVAETLGHNGGAQVTITDCSTVIKVNINDQGYPVPVETITSLTTKDVRLLVPVPAFYQNIKGHDLSLALSWRMATRSVFTHYFQQGWQVVGFIKNEVAEHEKTSSVHYYLLEKNK